MSKARPSSAVDLVRPVIACLVAVYAIERGRGACAEIDPLLMIRPPCGCWLSHHPERLAGAEERAGQVHRDHLVPRVELEGVDVDVRGSDARVVEQQVDPAVPLDDRVEQVAHARLVGDVGRDRLEGAG